MTPPVVFGTRHDTRKWVRAANEIAARIADGRYPPGQWLPPTGKLLAEHGPVNEATIRRALQALHARKLVSAAPGTGYYAGGGDPPPAPPPSPLRHRTAAAPPWPAAPTPHDGERDPKWVRAAKLVRARIQDGTLRPGQPAPSGGALAVITGYSPLTCRRALRSLVSDGTLVPGPSPTARPRVPARFPARQPVIDAGRALSAGLASRRHAARLTQPQFAALLGYSVTTIGHAETGRLWQGREFRENADNALNAGGELLALHDTYRHATATAGQSQPSPDTPAAPPGTGPAPAPPAPLAGEEHQAVEAAWLLYEFIARHVLPPSPGKDRDLAEVRDAVSRIQHVVTAHAAARTRPGEPAPPATRRTPPRQAAAGEPPALKPPKRQKGPALARLVTTGEPGDPRKRVRRANEIAARTADRRYPHGERLPPSPRSSPA